MAAPAGIGSGGAIETNHRCADRGGIDEDIGEDADSTTTGAADTCWARAQTRSDSGRVTFDDGRNIGGTEIR